ncbi:hypothetical protein [Symbioplanes lichenis]|uniref:hypothetical protein n=1 Tax=Symbioplanes lichenis TaxID=1629072 RepID=UPI00273A1904|nr:hypothetical protein [Actinoplanes lichenis]
MIRDLVAPFAELDADLPGDSLVAQWHERVVTPHAAVFRAVEAWIDPARAADALPGLVSRRAELLGRTPRAHAAVIEAQALLRRILPGAGPVDAVILAGLGQANGWATSVDGEPTLFLAVERLPEPGFDVLLALHELVHAEHLRRAARDWPHDRVDADLFREGLAVHVTAQLLPGIDAAGQLWFAPGFDEWVARCERQEPALRRQAAADLARDDASSRWFTGGPDGDGDLPGRCGYWLGRHLVRELTADVSLETAMNWSLADVSRKLRRLLEG